MDETKLISSPYALLFVATEFTEKTLRKNSKISVRSVADCVRSLNIVIARAVNNPQAVHEIAHLHLRAGASVVAKERLLAMTGKNYR